jgi:hypothetical protein
MINAQSGIRIRDPSNQAAKTYVLDRHQDRHTKCLLNVTVNRLLSSRTWLHMVSHVIVIFIIQLCKRCEIIRRWLNLLFNNNWHRSFYGTS